MDNYLIYIQYTVSVIGFLTILIAFIKKTLKNPKAKKLLEKLEAFGQLFIPFIKQAEEFKNYTGAEKKNYVMVQLAQWATNNGIEFDSNQVASKIDELVGLTNHVNTEKKKDDIINETVSTNHDITKIIEKLKKELRHDSNQ